MEGLLKNQSIDKLDISENIIKKLKNNEIDTLEKLCKQTRTNLKKIGIEQFEAKSIDIQLQLIGLSLTGSL